MKVYEVGYLVLLFIVGTLLWTLPIQSDQLPFGEGDAAWHFANGDWATKTDHVYWRFPFYISTWYYNYNTILGPGALEYPPPYHVGYSIFQIIGGQRFIPVYILIAISSFLAAFAVFVLLRKLYGFPTAVLASAAIVFSFREIMVYLWGQRPTILSFAFVPLILYSLFRYYDGYYKNQPKVVYLYLTGMLLISQFLVHPQGAMLSFASIIIYLILQSFRKKQFPVNKSNLIHFFVLLAISAMIILPFINIYRGAQSGVENNIQIKDMHRLFDWMEVKDREGYPNNLGGPPIIFYEMNKVYFPFYYIFVWIGILYLLIRRDDKDILILSWLVALYLLIHLDVLGLMPFGRLSRMLMGETALFYSIIAIGIIGIPNLFLKEDKKHYVYVIVGILLFGLVLYNGKTAYDVLNNAYKYPLRISQEQYETAQWIDNNLPQDAYLYYVGVITYPKQRFMYVLSHRPGVWQSDRVDYPWMNITNILIDYSDAVKLNNQQIINELSNYEQQFINAGLAPVYNQSNIRIYNISGGRLAK